MVNPFELFARHPGAAQDFGVLNAAIEGGDREVAARAAGALRQWGLGEADIRALAGRAAAVASKPAPGSADGRAGWPRTWGHGRRRVEHRRL